jgi:hypothetical protein
MDPPPLPDCPHLPPAAEGVDWRLLAAHRDARRDGRFYLDCLRYGQSLWRRRLPARSILCLDRAFGAELGGGEPELGEWPLPYAALAWMMPRVPGDLFVGNPRVHFQHYAGRMNEPRREQRRWRAWACWEIVRRLRPDLPGDPRHVVREPGAAEIGDALAEHGHPGERDLWLGVVGGLAPKRLV